MNYSRVEASKIRESMTTFFYQSSDLPLMNLDHCNASLKRAPPLEESTDSSSFFYQSSLQPSKNLNHRNATLKHTPLHKE